MARSDPDIREVQYADERPTIKDADVVLFRGRDPLSRIIRWVTKSHYSHAGIVAWWDRGEYLMVMEAKGAGVVASRLSRIVDKYHGQVELFTAKKEVEPGLNRDKAVHEAKKELGTEYAKMKLFRIWRRLIVQMTDVEAPRRPPEKFICSEYVSRSWRKGGVPLADVAGDLLTPKEISESPHLERVGLLMADRGGAGPVVILQAIFRGAVNGAMARMPGSSASR